MKIKTKLQVLVGILFFASALTSIVLHSQHVLAATLTVDTVSDLGDQTPGDGICSTTGNECSLRAGIEEADALAGPDSVNFTIPGEGIHTISPASDLPAITEQLTIDGITQPGSSCGTLVPSRPASSNTPHNLLIEIRGAPAILGSLLDFSDAPNSIVRGLVLSESAHAEQFINLTSSPDSTIECNYIGTNPSGTNASGLAFADNAGLDMITSDNTNVDNNLISGTSDGLRLHNAAAHNNLIGTNATGTAAIPNQTGISASSSWVENNVISGNANVGVAFSGNFVNVTGNLIGLGLTGAPLGNGGDGLYINNTAYVLIGGGGSESNVISANGGSGIHIFNRGGVSCSITTINTIIIGNRVGTNTGGVVQSGYGNHQSGITLNETHQTDCGVGSVTNHQIGDTDQEAVNIIAGNVEDGIRLYQVSDTPTDVYDNSIFGNSIYSNGGLGINLAADTDNDGFADTDLGPNPINDFALTGPSTRANNYINYPVISAVSHTGFQAAITYDFAANPHPDVNLVGFRLDFYLNDSMTTSSYGQGQTPLGSFVVDGTESNASHTFTSPIVIQDSMTVTATATSLNAGIVGEGFNTHRQSVASRVHDFLAPSVHAAEITPADGFILGSTSEFSPAFALAGVPIGITPAPSTSSNSANNSDSNEPAFANTGTSASILIAVSLGIVVASLALRHRFRKVRRGSSPSQSDNPASDGTDKHKTKS